MVAGVALMLVVGGGVLALWTSSPGEPTGDAGGAVVSETRRTGIGQGRPELPDLSRLARPDPPADFIPPDPGLMGAARAIVDAGAGHDRRCVVEGDLTDVEGLSELLPPRRVAADAVRILRREPTGHLVVSTADGPVELLWTEHTCTVRRARSGTVSGEVTTADGRPVEGADVRVCSQTTRTDRDGRYVIEATVDGSAPVTEDRAWCTLRASHPDHGTSITEPVDLLEDPVVLIALEVEAPDPADLQMQQQTLQEQAQAIVQGEIDPAFEAAASEADILAELAERPDLDAATRRALYEAARQRIDAAGDNSEVVEALQRGPER